MNAPPLMHIESSPSLPREADVVVIGGGVVGVFTSYYLARRGLKVALLEKGRVAAEQSSRNWGWCRQQNRDARELPISTKSLDLWERVAHETGEDTGFRRCGLLYLSNDDNELAGWAKWGDFARSVGVTTHMLSADQANERGMATSRKWKGGVFSPTDGTADPSKAVPVAARAIMAAGGTVHQNCAARGIELSAGRVNGVVTEAGTIRTKTAVMAGGAWASSFCHQYAIRFPQASVRQSILAVAPGAAGLPDALHTALVSPDAATEDTRWQLVGARELIRRRSSSGSAANSCPCSPAGGEVLPRERSRACGTVMNRWRNGRWIR
jgi:glycine/D-amino acid oxidase-like deaminating enzyme